MREPDYPPYPQYPNISSMTAEERAAYWKWRKPFSDADSKAFLKLFEVPTRVATTEAKPLGHASTASSLLAAIHNVGRLGFEILAVVTGGILAGRRQSRKRSRRLP